MSITRFEEFLTLVGYMNYSTAAHKLNITQSALSKHIASLEKEFNATFIDRSHQQIELTQQGRLFCEEATKIVEAYTNAYQRIHCAAHEIRVSGSLRDSAIRYLLSTAQEVLYEQGKEFSVVSQPYAANAIRNALVEKKIDVVIDVASDEDIEQHDPETDIIPLMTVPLIAVMGRNNSLSDHTSLTIEDLAHVRIMHPTGSMDVQRGADAIKAVFDRHGITMNKHVFFASSWNDFPSVSLGDDVFVMPRSLYSRQLFGHLFDAYRCIPISDGDACFPYCVFRRSNETHPEVLLYIEALKQAAERIDEK